MNRPAEKPNWTEAPSMVRFYEQAQAAEGGLEPDEAFLRPPSLGLYEPYQLRGLELPEGIRDFLTHVGLPDRFETWRSPDEEAEDRRDAGIFFWVSCLRILELRRKRYLVIGESRSLGRSSAVRNYGKPDEVWIWNKTESRAWLAAELKTGSVWNLVPEFQDCTCTFVNGSLEQFLLSMAYWRSFYAAFSGKVRTFQKERPDGSELDYIFKSRRSLYAPFLMRLKALDPEAAKKRTGFWRFMCDLSLY